MRNKSILIVLLSTVLGVGIAWKGLSSGSKRALASVHSAAPSEPSATPDPTLALQRQINQLLLRVLEMHQQMAQTQAAAASAAASGTVVTAAPAAPMDAEQDRKILQERMDEITAEFQAESRNAPWARDRAAEFHTAIDKSELLKNALQSIDCRSSMCRVEMLDDRSQKFFLQLNDMVMSTASNFPSMSGQHVKRADGTPVTVYYFTKESG